MKKLILLSSLVCMGMILAACHDLDFYDPVPPVTVHKHAKSRTHYGSPTPSSGAHYGSPAPSSGAHYGSPDDDDEHSAPPPPVTVTPNGRSGAHY